MKKKKIATMHSSNLQSIFAPFATNTLVPLPLSPFVFLLLHMDACRKIVQSQCSVFLVFLFLNCFVFNNPYILRFCLLINIIQHIQFWLEIIVISPLCLYTYEVQQICMYFCSFIYPVLRVCVFLFFFVLCLYGVQQMHSLIYNT